MPDRLTSAAQSAHSTRHESPPMQRPRVTTRTMMTAVAVAALACAVPPMSNRHTWWEIKPFLNLVFLPLVAIVFSLRSPARPHSGLW